MFQVIGVDPDGFALKIIKVVMPMFVRDANDAILPDGQLDKLRITTTYPCSDFV